MFNKSKKRTQVELVLAHIQKKGSITSWEAIKKYGVTRLSAIIYILRYDLGVNIFSETLTKKNRYGEYTHFTKYRLGE